MATPSSVKFYPFVHYISFVFSVFVSIFFGSIYTEGDQHFYKMWFDEISKLNLVDGYFYYASQVNYFEILHFAVNWFGGLVFDKLTLYTIVNVLFVFLLVEVFRKVSFSPLLAMLIILTNFYIPVLLLAAERLKFGFLFLFLFLLVNTKKRKLMMAALTLIGHLQFLVLWASLGIGVVVTRVFRYNSLSKVPKSYFAALFVGMILLFIFKDHLLYKLLSYVKYGGLNNIFKPLAFMIISIYCCRSKVSFIIGLFMGLTIASFILGAERITIFACVAFFYFSSFRNKGFNVPTLLLIPYFGFKSIEFYTNIITNGTGF
ncbi:hypothetical protein U5315_003698 [Vibrio fluvialis]|nr:hypothetical protein [Vibrio fluvialis]EMA8959585.1 hypothetical protein [Vibrio fluvialis]